MNKKRMISLIVGAVILLVVIAVLIVVIALNRGKNTDEQPVTPTSVATQEPTATDSSVIPTQNTELEQDSDAPVSSDPTDEPIATPEPTAADAPTATPENLEVGADEGSVSGDGAKLD